MKPGRLVSIALGIPVVYLAVLSLVPAAERVLGFAVANVALKSLAAIGCMLAAARYGRGDYLGVAWFLIGSDYALLAAKDLLFGRTIHLSGLAGAATVPWRNVFLAGANVTAAVGQIMLARVWRAAGMALPSSRMRPWALIVAAIALSFAIVGWTTWSDLRTLDGEALTDLLSSVGDVICFSAIAPIFLTALAMRGGTLFWPWILLTTSSLSWLFYDMSWGLMRHLGSGDAAGMRMFVEAWRGLACALAFAAGLAQRNALARPRHSAD